MRYLLVALFLVAVAGAEVLHALSNDQGAAALCTTPDDRAGAVRDMLSVHGHAH